MTDPPEGGLSDALRRAGPYLGLGTTLAAAIAVLMGGGYWLDRKLGTQPWLTLLGALMGMVVGFYNLFDTLRRHPPE